MVLENDLCKLLEWFTYNGMTVNPKKFLLFHGLKRKQKLRINNNGVEILAKKHAKLLVVEIDDKLKNDSHVEALTQKVNKKSSTFVKLRPHSHYTGFITYRITSYIR